MAAAGLQMFFFYVFFFLRPQWFCGETGGEEDAEILTGNKFRADLAYRERQFEVSARLSRTGLGDESVPRSVAATGTLKSGPVVLSVLGGRVGFCKNLLTEP